MSAERLQVKWNLGLACATDVAAELAAAEERGRRSGVEERDELLREAQTVLKLWPSTAEFGRSYAHEVCVRIDRLLAPRDSGEEG